MRKAMKFLSLFLCFLLCLPAFALAQPATEGDFTYTLRGDTAAIQAYTGNEAVVTIPATLGGYPVTVIAESAFEGNETLEKVIVPEGVERIGYRAFADCAKLCAVELPSSLKTIDDDAFEGCAESLSLYGDGETVNAYAVAHGLAVAAAEVPVEDEALFIAATDKNGARLLHYAGESGFFAVPGALGGAEVYAVSEEAFAGNAALYAVALPESVRRIGYRAFADCTNLAQIVIPMGVESIDEAAFEGCEGLTLLSDTHSGAIEAYAEAHGFSYQAMFEMDKVERLMGDRHMAMSSGKIIEVGFSSVSDSPWQDATQIARGKGHTAALKADGTVAADGSNSEGQCNVASWSNITQVACGYYHTIGLKEDGTVVAVGNNEVGQCDLDNWTSITQVAGGYAHTVGLKGDGTLVAVGLKNYGQCNVIEWKSITRIACGGYYTAGVKENGTVVTDGSNGYGQCNVDDWTNIVQFACGSHHTVGLKEDGTVVAVGRTDFDQCNVNGWANVTQVACGEFLTVGLKEDGAVLFAGENADVYAANLNEYQQADKRRIASLTPPTAAEGLPQSPSSAIPPELVGTWKGTGKPVGGGSEISLEFVIGADGTGNYTFQQAGYVESRPVALSKTEERFTVDIPKENPLGATSCEGDYSYADGVLTLHIITAFSTGRQFEYVVDCTKENAGQASSFALPSGMTWATTVEELQAKLTGLTAKEGDFDLYVLEDVQAGGYAAQPTCLFKGDRLAMVGYEVRMLHNASMEPLDDPAQVFADIQVWLTREYGEPNAESLEPMLAGLSAMGMPPEYAATLESGPWCGWVLEESDTRILLVIQEGSVGYLFMNGAVL